MSYYFRKYVRKEHFPVHPQTIKYKTGFRNCVSECFKERQWKEVENDDWDVMWIEKEVIPEVMDRLPPSNSIKINHYRNSYELCRKDMLLKNLKKHKKQLEKENKVEEAQQMDFFPLSYLVPSEYTLFLDEYKKYSSDKQLWIMKPIGRAQGKGIFLFKNIKAIEKWEWKQTVNRNGQEQPEPYVVQRYIDDPLLIGGKKFDLRIFALVTSFQPLTIYLNRTGFARFTHHHYDTEDFGNIHAHITNVAIQKTSDNYDEKLGGKWFLHTLKLYMISKFGEERVSETFYQIQQMIIKSIQSVQKQIINDKRSFELYGYDILIDKDLKPWIIEVNASPSMTANTKQDADAKLGILDDVFTIIDLEKVLTGEEEQVGGFDLIFKNGPIKLPSNSTYTSLLGCYNNREQQLKKLAKSSAIRLAQRYQEQFEKKQKDFRVNPAKSAIQPRLPLNQNMQNRSYQTKYIDNSQIINNIQKTNPRRQNSNQPPNYVQAQKKQEVINRPEESYSSPIKDAQLKPLTPLKQIGKPTDSKSVIYQSVQNSQQSTMILDHSKK